MRQYGVIYEDYEQLKLYIANNKINGGYNVLVQVFVGIVENTFIKKVIGDLLAILPEVEIIGATTDGEIYNDKIYGNTVLISFTVFEKTKIKSILINNIDNDEYKLGISIAKELVEEDTKVIILFSSGGFITGRDLIKGLESVNGDIAICGGRAGNNGLTDGMFVFTNKGVSDNGVVAVSLSGKQLRIIPEHSLGWSPIGKHMTVTKVENSRIYTIDNMKAVDIYKKYLGEEVAEGLPGSANEFPLIINEHGIEIAKVPSECYEDGSMKYLGGIEVNDKVRFGYANIKALKDNSVKVSEKMRMERPEAIFVYSCSVRRIFIQEQVSFEIEPLSRIAPTFGFFTYGEFFKINETNKLLNLTLTILGISEEDDNTGQPYMELPEDKTLLNYSSKGKEFEVIRAFTNLVNQATNELEQANSILEKEKENLEKMNGITKAILQINSEMIVSGKFDNLLQLILNKTLEIIPNGRMGSILLQEGNVLVYRATNNYSLDKIGHIAYKIEDTYLYRTNTDGDLFNPLVINNLEENLFNRKDDYRAWFQILKASPKELLTSGIGIDGQFMGVINIFNTYEEADFNERDKNLLKYICYDIAVALRNYILLKDVFYMSRHDSLTGLYNRHYFTELLKKKLIKAKTTGENLIIGIIDLNNLKAINDTYGHDAGDQALVRFSDVFKMTIREDDILGRTGGDEFFVLFVNKDIDEVTKIIDKTRELLKERPLGLFGEKSEVTFAYGISEFPKDSEDVIELYRIADKRMYEKKKEMKKE